MRWSTTPPTLLVRTLTVTVSGVVLLLSLIFVVLTVNTRQQVRQNVTATLESTQHVVAELEALRQRQLQTQAAILAESPTLKAAIDTYALEAPLLAHDDHDDIAGDGEQERADLLETVRQELRKVAAHVSADVIMLVEPSGRVLASVGRLAAEWPAGRKADFELHPASAGATDGILHQSDSVYRTVWVDLAVEHATIGRLYVSTLLDDEYAHEIGRLASTQIAFVMATPSAPATVDRQLFASTLAPGVARQFGRYLHAAARPDGTVSLDDESYAFRRLVTVGELSVYALGSIDALSREATAAALSTLALVGLGALLFALAGSIWLANTVARPIGQLSTSMELLASTHNLREQLPVSGSSRELDTLTDTFNNLMSSLAVAERATDAAYTGAIRALAAALDARDPYTAGHSERVSVLSVAIGRTLQLGEEDLEVLRLGALLHDIGKIGVPDAILRKPGPLTPAELAQINQHPVLGARILRSVPFLAPHVPIVELHHERPDGRGYPYGLTSEATPLAARIVHVADAYDAMTSARAYRAARSDAAAIAELQRCAGREFDETIVEALIRSRRMPGPLESFGDELPYEPAAALVAR